MKIRRGIGFSDDNHQIHTGNELVMDKPDVFPDQPSHPVAHDAFSDFFAGGYAKSDGIGLPFYIVDDQGFRRGILSLAIDPAKIVVSFQYRQFTHTIFKDFFSMHTVRAG